MSSAIKNISRFGNVIATNVFHRRTTKIRKFPLSRSCSHASGNENPARADSDTVASDHTDEAELFDIVISGGGMVGTAMACALGNEPVFQDKKVLLLEAESKKNHETLPENYANRVSALSLATKELLSSFGAWEHITNMRHQPVRRMQVWDACSDSMIAFNHPNLDEDVAYLVENDVTLSAIYRQLQKVSHCVQIRYETKAEGYKFPKSNTTEGNNQWTQVHLANGETINTRLLIGADGPNSLVRKSAEIRSFAINYKQMGVVATLHLSEPTENNVAWQRFLPNGPVAILPLSESRSSLVWTTTPEHTRALLKLPADQFVDALNDALWTEEKKDGTAVYAGQLLEKLLSTINPDQTAMRQLPPSIVDIDEKSRAAFPLGLSHADHYCANRMALIGDAAHRVHPLAGQGVNLGFGDVSCLKNKLCDAVYNGSDVGSLSHLLEYETDRQRHVVPIIAAIDGLNRLYSTDFAPFVLMRSLGLQATNACTPVKDFLRSQATLF